ncbi:unnamed protein product [Caenorhabditis auriculariae]|uniref:Uncharacterized protein n=1 Tax=Caenorhabditis auriculariae TaxID=2777116 RepID=A0A8S1H0V7_9PELO|nr:unnamed protein product [Caenorhabditis auriculariae]
MNHVGRTPCIVKIQMSRAATRVPPGTASSETRLAAVGMASQLIGQNLETWIRSATISRTISFSQSERLSNVPANRTYSTVWLLTNRHEATSGDCCVCVIRTVCHGLLHTVCCIWTPLIELLPDLRRLSVQDFLHKRRKWTNGSPAAVWCGYSELLISERPRRFLLVPVVWQLTTRWSLAVSCQAAASDVENKLADFSVAPRRYFYFLYNGRLGTSSRPVTL